ncbi:hypothetical protein QX201_007724 [Fusarium graminearum]|uniref:Anaphase-promoting complex subunit 4 WD40 domain-containing protein n=1 Tax=Gibberella zeae TaxID=5518 RepID=A0A9N8WWP7_GIBZA|nr:unnamed protein product [Fusarium graminearum]CAG1997519.1 unnamed protein product [Fusarium graminearum]
MLATQCAFNVKIWNIEAAGECVYTFKAGQIDLRLETVFNWPMAFSSHDSQFAFRQGENVIEVHDLTEKTMYEFEWENVSSLVFLPDGRSLAAGNMHGNVKVWDLQTKDAQERNFKCHGSVLAIACSSDGGLLAHSASTNEIYLWTLRAEGCFLKLKIRCQVGQLSFSPDGRSLMTDQGCLVPEYWPSNIEIEGRKSQADNYENEAVDVSFAVEGYGTGFDGAWLTKDGERFIWLPPEHRPSSNALIADGVVMIRNTSDQLLVFGFND